MTASRWLLSVASLAGLVLAAAAQPPAPPGGGTPAAPAGGAVQPPATGRPAAPAQPAAGDTVITWKLEKGKSFFQEMMTTTKQTMKVMGMDVVQEQTQTFYLGWTVKDVTPEGNYVLVQKIEGVKLNINIGGNSISFDSTAATPAANTALSEFFKALVGSEFTLTLDKSFKVIKVEGRDAFLQKLTQANQQMEALLKKILSEDALKQMAEPSFGLLPPTAVKQGAIYTKNSKLSLGPIGSYDTTFTYTYEGKDEKQMDKLKVGTALTYSPPAATEPNEGLPFKIKEAKLTTKEGTGDVRFDSAKGRLDSSTMKLVLEGTLTIEIGGMATPVDLKQEQTTTVKTADASFVKKPA